ncbi:MAG TPA: response regulator, partial [Archangium sp.]
MIEDSTCYKDQLVVVVSRDSSTRELLRNRLETMGFSVLEFEQGRDVLQRDTSEWTAVCLDLDLEDMGGMDVLRHLRARDALLPILSIAGDRDIDAAVQAVRLGAYDSVTKPLEGQRVIQSLREAAGYRRESWRVQQREQAGAEEKLMGRL